MFFTVHTTPWTLSPNLLLSSEYSINPYCLSFVEFMSGSPSVGLVGSPSISVIADKAESTGVIVGVVVVCFDRHHCWSHLHQ